MHKTNPALLCALLLAACGPTIQSVAVAPIAEEPKGRAIDGITYFEPGLFVVTYSFRTQIDDKGTVVRSANEEDAAKRCVETIQKEELQLLPDFTHRRALLYHSHAFSSTKFSATLSNGMLTAVGAEHTPQVVELLKAGIESAVKPFSPTFLPTPVGAGKACNAGPVISDIRPWRWGK